MAHMFLEKGDKSKEVSEIQKLLSLLGYDLIIDGHYGPKTSRSVKSFQKKNSLTVDGIVGDHTYNALKQALSQKTKETDIVFDKKYENLEIFKEPLDSSQYIKQRFDKYQIFVHFTAGGSSAKNTIAWWNKNEPRIATAYVIDRNNANIYECFNPDFWSYHLGIKGTRGKLDKHSIGIEICNWGPLEKKNGKYYAWPAKKYDNYSSDYEIKESEVCELDLKHRGYKYYQKYTQEQINNLEKLLIFLVKEYEIPVEDCYDLSWFYFKEDVVKQVKPGIWNHVNVRKDKYDLFPQKELIDMLNRLADKFNTPEKD